MAVVWCSEDVHQQKNLHTCCVAYIPSDKFHSVSLDKCYCFILLGHLILNTRVKRREEISFSKSKFPDRQTFYITERLVLCTKSVVPCG